MPVNDQVLDLVRGRTRRVVNDTDVEKLPELLRCFDRVLIHDLNRGQ